MGLRLGLEDLDPARAAAIGELVAEPALADAGLGDDPDHRALAGIRLRQRPLQLRHLALAADEAREAALAGEVEPRARRADAGQLEHLDRLAGTLDLELAEVLQLEEAVRRARRCSRSGRRLPGSASASIRWARPTVWPIAV